MSLDNRSIPSSGTFSPSGTGMLGSPGPSSPAAVGGVTGPAAKAAAELGDDLADIAMVMSSLPVGALEGAVDVGMAIAAEVASIIPGAKLLGALNAHDVNSLIVVLNTFVPYYQHYLHGATFEFVAAEKEDDEGGPERPKPVEVLIGQKKMVIRKATFDLPMVNGKPGAELAIAGEMGKLMNGKSPMVIEFARLSGWRTATLDASGRRLTAHRPATGLTADMVVPFHSGDPLGAPATVSAPPPRQVRPLGPTIPPRGTQRLNPTELERPPSQPPAIRARATGPLPRLPDMAAKFAVETGKLPAALPPRLESADHGGIMTLADKSQVGFYREPASKFVPNPQAKTDPHSDLSVSIKEFLYNPELLLKTAPAKFLFLNADTHQFSPERVKAMAAAAGVDLGSVVTELLISGAASQATISRICEFHGLSADKGALVAKDQELLGKSANLDALLGRLALDINLNGLATSKLLAQGTMLAQTYHRKVGDLPLTRDPERVGLKSATGVFSWIAARASRPSERRLAILHAEVAETRSQFQRLPLVVQLKTDPKMALGAAWFRLSAPERALLSDPLAVQQFVARAAAKTDQMAYIPQTLGPTEKRSLVQNTVLDAIFDPGSAGVQFRAHLGGLPGPDGKRVEQNPTAGLKNLTARNGESVFHLMPDDLRRRMGDRARQPEFRNLLTRPELTDALAVMKSGAPGAEQVKMVLLKFSLNAAKNQQDPVAAVGLCLEQIGAARTEFLKSVGGNALEMALTEINRQVQEGNMAFIQKLVSRAPSQVEEALGPWVWQALSPAERKVLSDPDYRQHLVTDARHLRTTGGSLAEEARQYRIHTENIQQSLELLLRPDPQFRKDFARDPMQALQKRGIWNHLPTPTQTALTTGDKAPQLSALTEAVEQAIAPISQRKLGHQRQSENLRAAIGRVNATNVENLVQLLNQRPADITRVVKGGLASAMDGGSKEYRGGILSKI